MLLYTAKTSAAAKEDNIRTDHFAYIETVESLFTLLNI
jgi:hypothetical protein